MGWVIIILLGHKLFLLFNFGSSLYILDTSFKKIKYVIFSQFAACRFIFLTVSFKDQKFYILMKSNFSVCSFMNHAFDMRAKKSLPNLKSQRVSSLFSPGRIRVLGFIFMSTVHLKIILCMRPRWRFCCCCYCSLLGPL